MQEAQAKQLNQIQDAIDENRPVYLEDMEILGDPTDNADIEPLELMPIPTVSELVAAKIAGEEDVVRELKAKQ
jgi:hypothetical protein